MNAPVEYPPSQGVLAHIVLNDAAAAIEFYEAAFGAREIVRLPNDAGKLVHAAVEINGGTLMLVDEFPEWGTTSPRTLGSTTLTLHLNVVDARAAFDKAVAAGATAAMEPREMFWGDIYGMVTDPFGYSWSFGQPVGAPKTQAELIEALHAARWDDAG